VHAKQCKEGRGEGVGSVDLDKKYGKSVTFTTEQLLGHDLLADCAGCYYKNEPSDICIECVRNPSVPKVDYYRKS
jgi:hypothetical protein